MNDRWALLTALLLLIGKAPAPAADDAIERLQDFLTVSAFDGPSACG